MLMVVAGVLSAVGDEAVVLRCWGYGVLTRAGKLEGSSFDPLALSPNSMSLWQKLPGSQLTKKS